MSLDPWHKNSPPELHFSFTLQPSPNLMQGLAKTHSMPMMANPTLLALPQELKIKIFEYLFHNTRVVICRVPLKRLEQCNILYICRQLYFDARPVLADSIKISIIGMVHPVMAFTRKACLGIPKTLQPYYRTRIQDITVDIGIGLNLVNFQEFSNLKVLHTRSTFRGPLGLSTNPNMEQSRRILAGRLDQEVKEATRTFHISSAHRWLAEAIANPDRRYKILVHSKLIWFAFNNTGLVSTGHLVSSY